MPLKTFVHKYAGMCASQSLLANVLICSIMFLQYAIKNRCRHKQSGQKKAHWLDWAEDKYDVSKLSIYLYNIHPKYNNF